MRKRRQGTLAGPLSSAVFASAENISEGYSSVESQKLPVLAVTSKTRLPIVPDAPTLMELGYKTMRRNPATPDVAKSARSRRYSRHKILTINEPNGLLVQTALSILGREDTIAHSGAACSRVAAAALRRRDELRQALGHWEPRPDCDTTRLQGGGNAASDRASGRAFHSRE